MTLTTVLRSFRRTGAAAPMSSALLGERHVETRTGVVLSTDAEHRVFVLAANEADTGDKGRLLCGLSADASCSHRVRQRILMPGRQLRVTGYQVTPSVYKPFRFEVLAVEGRRHPRWPLAALPAATS